MVITIVILHYEGVLEIMQHLEIPVSLHPLSQGYMRSATVLISLETPPKLE